MSRVRLATGDCLERLKKLPDNSIDLIVTDPPYGLTSVDPKKPGGGSGKSGFMGQKWDAAVPSVDIWKVCLQKLKPGAFAFILCSPRQDCLARMILNLEEAGFVTGYSMISWVYATGFPKAASLSKLADRRAGAEREVVGTKDRLNQQTKPCHKMGYSGPMREQNDALNITAPSTPEAKALDGSFSGFQPKPAQEPILCVMKPIEHPTYLDQALDNNHGCTWLDNCRIPTGENLDGGGHSKNKGERWDGDEHWRMKTGGAGPYVQPTGRFPANVLCSDDVLNDGRDRHGAGSARFGMRDTSGEAKGMFGGHGAGGHRFGDSGSFSRYFDLDAWFAQRIGELPKEVQRVFPNLLVAKPSKREKNAGLEGTTKRAKREVYGDGFSTATKVDPVLRTEAGKDARPLHANHHVSVKPVKLMSYLITLGSREGETVLDPFMGSGTTGVAAVVLNRNFIGCELDPEFVEISRRRIQHAKETGVLPGTEKPKLKKKKPASPGLWEKR